MKMKSLIFTMMILVSSGVMAFSVSGDSFDANFKITSVNPGNGGTVITGEGIAGGDLARFIIVIISKQQMVFPMKVILMGMQEPLIKMV
jgi:hypothetical protein